MQNYRPLQKQYQSKSTVKHHNIVIIEAIERLDIKNINISDRDKYGCIVYKGSGNGGSKTSIELNTEEEVIKSIINTDGSITNYIDYIKIKLPERIKRQVSKLKGSCYIIKRKNYPSKRIKI